MKLSLYTVCLLIISFQAFGQNLKISQAESYYKALRYADANPIYKELIQKDKINIVEYDSVFHHAIITADKAKDFQFKYELLMAISQAPTYNFDDAFSYFQISTYLGFYENAKTILASSIVQNSNDPRKELLLAYQGGSVWEDFNRDTSIYKISKSSFNSDKADFNPIYHPKGIVFTSARDNTFRKSTFDNSAYLDLYLAKSEGDKVEEIKFLDSRKHDGTVYYDSINLVWYYSKNHTSNKIKPLITTGIFMYNENTKEESAFTFNSETYYLAQPFLTDNGNKLWFSSDKPGGQGKADIWYSNKTKEGWSEPINAGADVNTSEDEMFPFFQNKTLYFSSNGHPGLGGLDLFSCKFIDGVAASIVNAGAHLNSNADDFSLVLNATDKEGYFSSGRENYTDNIYHVVINRLDFIFKGTLVLEQKENVDIFAIPVIVKLEDKIIDTLYADKSGVFEFSGDKNSNYTFEIDNPLFAPITEKYSTIGKTESDTTLRDFNLIGRYVDVASTVFDDKTKEPLANSKVELKDKATGEVSTFMTDKNGNINAKLLRNHEFELLAQHEGYVPTNASLSTNTRDKEMIVPVAMKSIEVGSFLAVKQLHYDFNKSNLKPESKLELDRIAQFLKENPTVTIEFSSFTDARGTDAYNLILSQKRTESSVQYIISKGIAKERIIGKWFGETILLNHCKDGVNCTEEEHTINRRTEIKIISIKD